MIWFIVPLMSDICAAIPERPMMQQVELNKKV